MSRFALLMGLLSPGVFAAAETSAKVCLLNFISPDGALNERYSKVINRAFRDASMSQAVTNINAAVPADLFKCLRSGAREIIMVMHAAPAFAPEEANLLWYRALDNEEREYYIDSRLKSSAQHREKYLKIYLEEVRRRAKAAEQFNRTEAEILYRAYDADLKKTSDLARDPSKKIYLPKPFLPATWMLFHDELARMRENGETIALEKIRIMSCLPDEVLARYPQLKEIEREFSITLDTAPVNRSLSKIVGHDVVSLDVDWLREGL